jgi:hypothetical protein
LIEALSLPTADATAAREPTSRRNPHCSAIGGTAPDHTGRPGGAQCHGLNELVCAETRFRERTAAACSLRAGVEPSAISSHLRVTGGQFNRHL